MEGTPLKSFEEDIRRLDVALRELKIKYDQFFGGGLDHEPLTLRREVERLVQRMTQEPPNKYALRYHFNALVGRYNSFSELWGRTLRSREEGEQRSVSARERLGLKHRLLARCRIGDPDEAEEDLRRLHGRFLAARSRQGKSPVSYEKFARGIAAQTRRLRSLHGCGQIEVRLLESEGDVQIRARPHR